MSTKDPPPAVVRGRESTGLVCSSGYFPSSPICWAVAVDSGNFTFRAGATCDWSWAGKGKESCRLLEEAQCGFENDLTVRLYPELSR